MCSCDNHLVLISSKETAVFSLISDIWNFMGIFAKALIPIVVYK